jgi:hypothetical protein
MVPKHQLDGVGMEEYLPFQAGDVVFADAVPDRSVRQIGSDHRAPALGIQNRIFPYKDFQVMGILTM